MKERIRNASWATMKNAIALAQTAGQGDDASLHLTADWLTQTDPEMAALQIINRTRALLLAVEEQLIVETHDQTGRTFAEIGDALGVSKQRAHGIYARIKSGAANSLLPGEPPAL